jgi:hypothetical protein
MPHILVHYAPPDHKFAHHLAVQLEQRGMVVWPVPDPALRRDEPGPEQGDGLADASHIVIVLSSHSSSPDGEPHWASALQGDARVIVVTCDGCTVPDALASYPVVDFEGQFLPGFEELVRRLKRSHAPTRPLTIEHPPPVAKHDLLPLTLPAERCWREDRLRINYTLPIILTAAELQTRLPAFLVQANFELERATFHRSPLAERVQDILAAVAYVRGFAGDRPVDLLCHGNARGWCLLALAAAPAELRLESPSTLGQPMPESLAGYLARPGIAYAGGLATLLRLAGRGAGPETPVTINQ